MVPGTCLQLLGLPQHVRHKLDLTQFQADLLHLAAQPPKSHPSATLFGPQDAFTTCDTARALYVQPVETSCSMFFGQTGPEGQPVLNPSQLASDFSSSQSAQMSDRPLNQTLPGRHGGRQPAGASQQKGALDICVGDAISLTVELHSALPQAVKLEGVTLTLALLQEVTIAYSPKSATSSKADFSRTASSIKQRATDSPTAPGSAQSRSGDLAAALAEDADVTTQWQETEELPCSLTQAHLGHIASDVDVASMQSSKGSQSDCSKAPSTAMVQPGINRLTFRALPLKRGLYTLKHVDASLGCLSLHIPVPPTPLSELSLRASSEPLVARSIAGSEAPGSGAAALGTVLNTGEVQQETVVLNVHSCRQRVAVSAAALRGALVAGQPQWLAIAIMPLHDSLHDACIHVGMVSSSWSGSDQAAGSAALSASLGSRSSTASISSPPDDASPTHLPGLDILHPDRAIVTPLGSDPLPQSSRSSKGQHDEGSRLAPDSTAGVHARPRQTELPQEQATVNTHRGEHESETGTSELRYDAGPEASVSGSSWVSLESSQGPNLPSWTATQPSLLWVWVQPGRLHSAKLPLCCKFARLCIPGLFAHHGRMARRLPDPLSCATRARMTDFAQKVSMCLVLQSYEGRMMHMMYLDSCYCYRVAANSA